MLALTFSAANEPIDPSEMDELKAEPFASASHAAVELLGIGRQRQRTSSNARLRVLCIQFRFLTHELQHPKALHEA